MSLLGGAWLVLKKDLAIEARVKEITTTTALFAILVVVLCGLALYVDARTGRLVAPGVLWLAITFAGVLSMGRSWARERENDAIRGLLLAPIPRASIYVGKALSTLAFLFVVELVVTPLVAMLFHVDFSESLLAFSLVLALGTLGFVCAGTLFSALTVRTGARDLMLAVVVFPLTTPCVLSSVVATRELLGGAPFAESLGWIQILLAYDLIFAAAGALLFEWLFSD
jgi:heme exporter protein B